MFPIFWGQDWNKENFFKNVTNTIIEVRIWAQLGKELGSSPEWDRSCFSNLYQIIDTYPVSVSMLKNILLQKEKLILNLQDKQWSV